MFRNSSLPQQHTYPTKIHHLATYFELAFAAVPWIRCRKWIEVIEQTAYEKSSDIFRQPTRYVETYPTTVSGISSSVLLSKFSSVHPASTSLSETKLAIGVQSTHQLMHARTRLCLEVLANIPNAIASPRTFSSRAVPLLASHCTSVCIRVTRHHHNYNATRDAISLDRA